MIRKYCTTTRSGRFKTLVFFIYLCSIYSTGFTYASLASIKEDLDFSTTEISTLAAFQTIGLAAGKLITGFIVDRYGPVRCLTFNFTCLIVVIFFISISSKIYLLTFLLMCMEFTNSMSWSSMCVAIRYWWNEDDFQINSSMWILSMSSRFSELTSLLFYGGLLSIVNWRQAAWVALIFPTLGLTLVLLFSRDSQDRKRIMGDPVDFEALKHILFTIFGERIFWVLACEHMCVTSIRRIDSFMTVFFTDNTTVSASDSAFLSIPFQLGFLVGLFTLGGYYKEMEDHNKKRFLLNGGYLIALCSLVTLAVLANTNATVAYCISFFFLTFGLSLPYYIIPGVFSVKFDPSHTALVANYLDGFGYVASSITIVVGGRIIDTSWQWHGYMALLTLLCLIGAIFLNWYLSMYGVVFPDERGNAVARYLTLEPITNKDAEYEGGGALPEPQLGNVFPSAASSVPPDGAEGLYEFDIDLNKVMQKPDEHMDAL